VNPAVATPTPAAATKKPEIEKKSGKPGRKPKAQGEDSVRCFVGEIKNGLPALESEYQDELDALISAHASNRHLFLIQAFKTEITKVPGAVHIVKTPVAK
jgi:hypothetical protein